MKITSLRVVNVRNHTDTSITLAPTTTLISGQNGSGKTSLLEAIHVALRGSSFRATDSEIARESVAWYRVELTDDTDKVRIITFDNRAEKKQKQFTIDEKVNKVLLARFRYPVVLFQPDDTRLINGSPARRRQYLDQVIAQYDPQYASTVRRYERVLAQRNRLLKQPSVTSDQLFAWDVIVSNLGAHIIAARRGYIARVNEQIEMYYQKIAKNTATIHIEYDSHGETTAQSLIDSLHRHADRDMQLGSTSAGPHRHDYSFTLSGKPAATTASRGEIRTIILALKYIEVDTLFEYTNEHPVILLDDVFGELDTHRQKQLLTALSDSQVVITSTEEHAASQHIKL